VLHETPCGVKLIEEEDIEMSHENDCKGREVRCNSTTVVARVVSPKQLEGDPWVDLVPSQDDENLEQKEQCDYYYYDRREMFPIETLKEGRCTLFDAEGEAVEAYIARRKVEIVGPMGCEHQPVGGIGSGFTKVDRPNEYNIPVMVIAELKEEVIPMHLVCEECDRRLRKRREWRRNQQLVDVTDDWEAYCFTPVGFWCDIQGRVTVDRGVDVSQGQTQKAVYEELCQGNDVLYIGKAKLYVEASRKW
jgi:hypothetical protein